MALHQEQDLLSLTLHTEAVRLMKNNPNLIDRALNTLERWFTLPGENSRPLLIEWRRILMERDWDAALSTSERGNQLRQASPASCVLPNKTRLEIIKSCKRASLST